MIKRLLFGTGNESEFWAETPNMGRNYRESSVMKDGEDLYKFQCERLASALLIKDLRPNLPTNIWDISSKTKVVWPNRGELLAGSFIANDIAKSVRGQGFDVDDLDIFFKSRTNAVEFCTLNNLREADFSTVPADGFCIRFKRSDIKFNLIWGVEYDDPEHLISRFDIRACSIALDPTSNKLWALNGALSDAQEKIIIFNPVPRATSIQRLVKYTQKGFTIDKYQRLFFSELIRSEIYSKDVELTTGYEVKSPG